MYSERVLVRPCPLQTSAGEEQCVSLLSMSSVSQGLSAPCFAPPDSLSTLQVQPDEDQYVVNWTPRQRGGGRGAVPPGQNRPPYQPAVPQPRGHPTLRGRGHPGPGRGAPPMRARGQFAGGRPAAGRGAGHQHPPADNAWEAGAGRPYQIPRNVKLNWESLGITQGSCFACGSQTHSFWQKECQYYGTQLFPQKCRNCGIGAHKNTLCTAKKSGELSKNKHARSAQIEEINDESDGFDFMFSGN